MKNFRFIRCKPDSQDKKCIAKLVQSKYFNKKMKKLQIKKKGSKEAKKRKSSQIYCLGPSLD